jgi:hypothetical protein
MARLPVSSAHRASKSDRCLPLLLLLLSLATKLLEKDQTTTRKTTYEAAAS